MLTRICKLGAGALIVLLLACCGSGESDSDVLDDIINAGLDFDGVFQDETGLTIELDGSNANVRDLGSSPFGQTGSFGVGDSYMLGMAEKGPGEWRGYVAYLANFLQGDPSSKVVMLDWATVYIKDGVLSFTDPGGVKRNFNWIADEWQTNTKPTDPGTQPPPSGSNDGTGNGNTSTLLSKTNIEGERKSRTVYTITIPSGASKLEVVLSEGEWGRQLADLFVRRGSQPVVVDEPSPYSWTADCASVLPNRLTETCTFTNPAAGTWYIMVYGYHAYYGATLTATLKH